MHPSLTCSHNAMCSFLDIAHRLLVPHDLMRSKVGVIKSKMGTIGSKMGRKFEQKGKAKWVKEKENLVKA